MPKLIDYPRTTYASAWEVAEVVDDTGGKCALETCARKLDRKVSGSFKAIVGSAVKFGLLTSKRELLSTTTLFRRIKHAYDKQEELLFHREAFLTPPLFTQLCRKFRQRELPVAMLDVMLIREFDVEEINAAAVAKAFAEGARAMGLLDEHNIVADIDQLTAQSAPRRELASPTPAANSFRPATEAREPRPDAGEPTAATEPLAVPGPAAPDAIATLFGLVADELPQLPQQDHAPTAGPLTDTSQKSQPAPAPATAAIQAPRASTPAPDAPAPLSPPQNSHFTVRLTGPGLDTQLVITDEDDLTLVQGLLEKIRRQLRLT